MNDARDFTHFLKKKGLLTFITYFSLKCGHIFKYFVNYSEEPDLKLKNDNSNAPNTLQNITHNMS